MRIAAIVPGGVDRSGTHRVIPWLLWLFERLARDHDVHVFAMRGEPEPGRWKLLGATVHNVGRGRPDSATLRTARALVRAHRREPFDVVHAFWASGPGVVAALTRPLVRAPVLLHVAGGDLVDAPDIGYGGRRTVRGRALVRLALATATRRTAASAPILGAVAALGYPADRLPPGVDRAAWPPRPPRPREPGRPARLVHVGSLNRVKDQPVLLRALARLRGEGVEASLDVAGADTLEGEIQRLAAELGVADRIRFHGFLTQEALRPLVERADLMVLSSRHESGPVAMLEAAAAGVPTVGTAVGRLVDWAPEAAATVPVGDPEALAGAVAALLADDPRRLRMAHRAQAVALEEDADWNAGRVAATYRDMVETRGSAASRPPTAAGERRGAGARRRETDTRPEAAGRLERMETPRGRPG